MTQAPPKASPRREPLPPAPKRSVAAASRRGKGPANRGSAGASPSRRRWPSNLSGPDEADPVRDKDLLANSEKHLALIGVGLAPNSLLLTIYNSQLAWFGAAFRNKIQRLGWNLANDSGPPCAPWKKITAICVHWKA